jgi:CRISPR-associated protein Csb2
MFALSVAFLTGRYVATSFDDRGRAEWPPHPARLFSALVAAHFEALDAPAVERDALLWLERQGAPEIAAPEASERDVMTVFVPVNDTSVVGSFEKETAALEAAEQAVREASGKGVAAAEKKRAKAEASLVEATRKATAEVPRSKEGKAAPAEAASLLPERRKRQPRTFPSVTPEGSSVVFAWPGAQPSAEARAALEGLAARVPRLGHSSSLVSVRVVDAATPPTWAPAGEGEVGDEETTLRVVTEGQLEAPSRCTGVRRRGGSCRRRSSDTSVLPRTSRTRRRARCTTTSGSSCGAWTGPGCPPRAASTWRAPCARP